MTRLELIAEAIADLTGATGPDRALDIKVAIAAHWTLDSPVTLEALVRTSGLEWATKNAENPGNLLFDLPRYTASYDGAMKLAGCDDHRRIEFGTIEPGNCWAYAHLDDDSVCDAEGCANEPIALCVALLGCIAARLERQAQEETL